MAAEADSAPVPQETPAASQDSAPFHFAHIWMRDNAGKLEDEYEVAASQLGEGSFGSVFRAKCKTTHVDRAVKAIEKRAVKNPIRFEREISIAKQLDHPNVVRLYETFRDATKIYLVMELCTGGELFDRIVDEAPTGFDEEHAAKYIRQILAALCYLHAQSFAHRDVKPENFLLYDKKPEAALKIIDFGLACHFEPGKPMATKAGTAYYVAPEVLKGSYDEKCDVWSAGVISFILLCGFPPFSGDTDPEILRKVKEGSFEFKSPEWDPISQGAKNLVTQMLTPDPALRPSADLLLNTNTNNWLKFKGTPEAVPIKPDFLKRLKSFNCHSKLKKVALTVVAQNMKDDDIETLQSTFRSLDKNGDGTLSPEEIREGMTKQGLQVPQALEDLLKSVDCNGSGTLEYTEFLAASLDKKLYMQRDVCWNAFRTFDLDGDGKITRDELSKVLNGNSIKTLGKGKIERLIAEVDRDGDGAVDFEEFVDMMMPAAKRPRTEGPSSWGKRASLTAETLEGGVS
jgi:calcium-dependent protein kinase